MTGDPYRRFIQAIDSAATRAPYEDVRTEASALMTEMLVVLSDCEAVKDRLMQDPAVQFLMEYLSSQNQ
ncbi:MAG: hypothetical protein WBM37_01980 [Nitrososphaeraceae archaeon]